MSVRYPGGLVGQGSRRELGRVLEGSWKDLGRLLEGSWKGLGRVLEELPTKSMLRMQPLLKRDYKPWLCLHTLEKTTQYDPFGRYELPASRRILHWFKLVACVGGSSYIRTYIFGFEFLPIGDFVHIRSFGKSKVDLLHIANFEKELGYATLSLRIEPRTSKWTVGALHVWKE